MKTSYTRLVQVLTTLTLTSVVPGPYSSVFAQPIIPANDGTNTTVTPQGNTFKIEGGQRSGDGANLFHSFQRFGLNEGQIANFLSNPAIRNILGRVTGGEASLINGLIQVTGGNSNLYLMNPTGIIFGPNASLNVPASFTATTATGIGFDRHTFFKAFSHNNWATLIGTPSLFRFDALTPGLVLNEGNLAVGTGQSLTLLGGTTINTGTLSAPSGRISLVAVPGQNWVRIGQAGHLLSLEITSSATNTPTLAPLSLPQLLTGGTYPHAQGVSINAQGQVVLSPSQTAIPTTAGTAIAAGTLDVSGNTGGSVALLGRNVGVFDSKIDASGQLGGGSVLIGGEFQGQGTLPNALRTVVNANSLIKADAIVSGNGGRVIVWADQTTGFFGNISARGGQTAGNGGFVEVSGKQDLIYQGLTDVTAANGLIGTLLLDPVNIFIQLAGVNDAELNANTPAGDPASQILAGHGGAVDLTLSAATLEAQAGNVNLQATNNITVAPGLSLNFVPGGPITFTADADSNGTGGFSMDTTQSINTNGRNLTLQGASVTVGNLITTRVGGSSGAINLTATNGAITAIGNLNTSATGNFNNGTAVNLVATGDITTNTINTSSSGAEGGGWLNRPEQQRWQPCSGGFEHQFQHYFWWQY